MKLQQVHVGNLAVFTTAVLKELGDFVVLVGANGSGKSFLLEALERLFEEFRIVGGTSSWSNEGYYWHGRRMGKPITVQVVLSLTDDEVERLFAPVQEVVEEVRREAPEKLNQLTLRRELHLGKGWSTASLAWADRELVRDDQVVSSSVVVGRPKRRDKALDAWTMEGFPPANTDPWKEHPRLLINRGIGQAFHSNAEIDELAEAGVIPVSVDAAGKEYHEWAAAEALALNERPPEEPEAPELFKASKKLTQFPAQIVSAELQQLLNSSFRLVPAIRETQHSPGQRSPSLAQATVNEVNSLLADLSNVEAEVKARRLREAYLEFTDKRLRDHAQGLFVEDGQALPFAHQGGGEQAVLALAKELLEGPAIVAIEEPEAHLHPVLARKLFGYLRSGSAERQVIVTTHSPIMMDKGERRNNWLFEIRNRAASAPRRLETEDDLRLVQAQLGSVPSDAYGKDVVLFVEGGTESEVTFPIWAAKLGRGFPDNVGLVRLGGKDRLLESLRIWLGLMKNAPAKYLVALDANAGRTKQTVVKDLKVPRQSIRLMVWRGLEDAFPKGLIVSGMKQLFDLEMTESELPDEDRGAFLNKWINEKGYGQPWKMALCSWVAGQMPADHIPADFSELLDDIDALLAQ